MHRSHWFLLLGAMLLLASTSRAEWATDGIAVCTASGEQVSPSLVPDDAGGAIVIWEDTRNTVRNIYAQRVDPSGARLWAAEGIAVSPFPFNQLTALLASDGAGGAIIVWEDIRHGVANKDIYAQRIDAAGNRLWTADGVPICQAPFDQSVPKLVPDTAGGAIIAWTDSRSGSADIYAQRINASGTPLWTTDGVPVCTVENTQGGVELIADDAAGAILLWVDFRSITVTGRDIYAQRLDATGQAHWTSGGVVVCTAAGNQNRPRLIADGASGAIVAWYDDRGSSLDIFAQRLGSSGVRLWSAEGTPLCTATDIQQAAELASDRAGGAVIAWQDARSGGSDIYAQRVDANGNRLWSDNGVPISTASDSEAFPTLVSFASGVVAIAWQTVSQSGETDLYAQRIATSGNVDAANLRAVCSAPRDQSPPRLILDSAGGTFIAWNDARDRNNDIYAQRLDDPTAIGLLEFTAAATANGNALSWQLASTALYEIAEVRVQRAVDSSGPWDDLATLLPSSTAAFVDDTASPGQTYWYRLLLLGTSRIQASVALQVGPGPTGPHTFLYPPMETPDGVVFRYALASAGQPRFEIVDILGRRVQTFDGGMRPSGEHLFVWNRNGPTGIRTARGVYVVRLQIGATAMARKLVLSR